MSGGPWQTRGNAADLDSTPTGVEEEQAFATADERKALQLQNKAAKLKNRQFKIDIKNRQQFSDRAYGLTQTWVGFIIVMTIAQFTVRNLKLGLSEAEFITVITTTTASILGFCGLM